MTREILFRGLRVDGKGWAYGYLIDEDVISYSEKDHDYGVWYDYCRTIHPHTVGQFTGLLDKNGVKVFEGDLVRVAINWLDKYTDKKIQIEQDADEVFWNSEKCMFSLIKSQDEDYYLEPDFFNRSYLIIGNIHEEAQP